MRCFGTNAYGQLGIGAPSADIGRGVAAGIDAVEVAVGLAHTCARTRDGHVGTSSRHSLALTTEDGATAAELLAFADRIIATAQEKFGVTLEREPTAVRP